MFSRRNHRKIVVTDGRVAFLGGINIAKYYLDGDYMGKWRDEHLRIDYLPLSDSLALSKDLGTRHRAAVGVSEVSDSLTIIVSEETGAVSTAYKGQIEHDIDADHLRTQLKLLQNRHREPGKFELIKRRFKNGKEASKNLHK